MPKKKTAPAPAPDVDHQPPPKDADALHAWLATTLDIHVPRQALVDGHHAPFDYLVHAFFEGRDVLTATPHAAPAPADAVVWASRGGGKTYLGAVATMLDMVFKPEIEIRILGGSMDQSRRMHSHLSRLFQHDALADLVKGNITDRRIRLRNKSEVELLAQSQVSVRGTRVQKLRCDEVELFDAEVWEAAQLVTRSRAVKLADGTTFEVRGSVECLSTMHRPHGLMSRLIAEVDTGRRRLFRWGVVDVLKACPDSFRCRAPGAPPLDPRSNDPCEPLPGDCPLLPECRSRAKHRGTACRGTARRGKDATRAPVPGHIAIDDAIAMKRRVCLATWEAEMLCLRPSRSSAVYPEFDPRLHVVDDAPPPGAEIVLRVAGMDFGFRAPTVVLWGAVDGAGVLWIVDERVVENVILDEHVRAIAASPHPRPDWIGIDPAGRRADPHSGLTDADVLRRAGFAVKSRSFHRQHGLGLVRARLRPAIGADGPRLFVHRRCARLIESLETYHYDPDRPESQDPVKDGSDHAADALRYLVQNLDRPHRTATGNYAC